MTVYSVTPFLNEVDLLEVRLRELDDVVDVHVIAESPYTFRGDAKPLLFDRDRFAPWLDKIRYVVTDRMEASPHQRFGEQDRWARENGQRAALADALDDVAGNDVVILSDLDEVPRAAFLAEYVERRETGLVCPEVPMYLYRVGWRIVERQASVLRVFRGAQLRHHGTPEKVRHAPVHNPSWITGARLGRSFSWAGWHMSYFGGVEAVRYKVANAAHPEEDVPEWLEPSYLAWCIMAGHDHRGNRVHQLVETEDHELPECVVADADRFRTLWDPLVWPADYDGSRVDESGAPSGGGGTQPPPTATAP